MPTQPQRERAFSVRSGMISRTPSGGAADERSGADFAPVVVLCPWLSYPWLRALCPLCPRPHGAAGQAPWCDRNAAADPVAHRGPVDHAVGLSAAGPVVVSAGQPGPARAACPDLGALRGEGGRAGRHAGQAGGPALLWAGALSRAHRPEPGCAQTPGLRPRRGGAGAVGGRPGGPVGGCPRAARLFIPWARGAQAGPCLTKIDLATWWL